MAKAPKVEKTQVKDLNEAQRKRLKEIVNSGVVQKSQIALYTESYNDLVKSGAEELNIEASDIKSAIDIIHKQNFHERNDKQDRIETIIAVTGNMELASGE